MTIVPITGPARPAVTRTTRPGTTSFALPAEARAIPDAAETDQVAPAALGALLSLQEMEPDSVRDRRARRQAQQVLDELRGLQLDLLGARPDPDRLARLSRLVETLAEAASPGLRAAITSISVRAAVELARHQMIRGAGAVHSGHE